MPVRSLPICLAGKFGTRELRSPAAFCFQGLGDFPRIADERIPVAELPLFQLPGKLQSRLVVSNKIVVDNEDLFAPAELQKPVEFSDQLRWGLRPRAASIEGDDVAELAGERAASRKLHRHETVLLQCQQVETRYRGAIDIGLFRNTIQPAG